MQVESTEGMIAAEEIVLYAPVINKEM